MHRKYTPPPQTWKEIASLISIKMHCILVAVTQEPLMINKMDSHIKTGCIFITSLINIIFPCFLNPSVHINVMESAKNECNGTGKFVEFMPGWNKSQKAIAHTSSF